MLPLEAAAVVRRSDRLLPAALPGPVLRAVPPFIPGAWRASGPLVRLIWLMRLAGLSRGRPAGRRVAGRGARAGRGRIHAWIPGRPFPGVGPAVARVGPVSAGGRRIPAGGAIIFFVAGSDGRFPPSTSPSSGCMLESYLGNALNKKGPCGVVATAFHNVAVSAAMTLRL